MTPAGCGRCFDNLLANVRAHTPPGTTATVAISRVGGEAICQVTDDGPGIGAEDAARLFERFFRADPSRSRASGGAGLGLSIVAAIVAAHGGTVAAARPRPPERGAVFTIRCPAADPADADPGRPTRPPTGRSRLVRAGPVRPSAAHPDPARMLRRMSITAVAPGPSTPARPRAVVEIVVPVYNEERDPRRQHPAPPPATWTTASP